MNYEALLKAKTVQLLILALLLSTGLSQAQTSKKNIPFTISTFNKSTASFPSFRPFRFPVRPGVSMGTEVAALSRPGFELPIAFSVAYNYDDRGSYQDHHLFANIELINRFKIWFFQIEPSFGVSYIHSFRIVEPNATSDPGMLPQGGLAQISPIFGFGFGFDLSRLKIAPIVLFLKAQLMPSIPLQKGYNMASSRSLAHFGIRYYPAIGKIENRKKDNLFNPKQ